ncbi:MAG: hypothetical protein GY820_15760 [Gammaproteobacteria bacterium]|nr:hypothetical protein [Gammaproteobacteria bacterium]
MHNSPIGITGFKYATVFFALILSGDVRQILLQGCAFRMAGFISATISVNAENVRTVSPNQFNYDRTDYFN